MEEIRMLNASQTANALCCAYNGPWLMPREVTITTKENRGRMWPGDLIVDMTAAGNLTITSDNPFIKWHPHGFAGVMTAEFTQQLGFLLAKEVLAIDGLPFMLELNIKSRMALQIGDTITAETRLVSIKGRGKRMQIFFESTVTKNGKIAMETTFYGMPVPTEKKTSSKEAEIIPEATRENFGAFVKQQAPFIEEALSVGS